MDDESVGNHLFFVSVARITLVTDEFIQRKSRWSISTSFFSCTLEATPFSCSKNFILDIFCLKSENSQLYSRKYLKNATSQ